MQALDDALRQHGLRGVRPRPGIADDCLPFPVTAVPWSTLGRFVTSSHIRPGGLLSFAAGDYAVQDAASLLPLTLMELQGGQRVIDCCAAPGGKSAAVLEQLRGTGLLVSNEVIASRVDTLQLTLARTGQSNYMITNAPVERLAAEMDAAFDCVLVDAPCTGQSLVARGKQSLSAFAPHQIAHSAARQRTILAAAVRLVRPGGRLIYSTCTFAYDENEGNVRWLRELLPGWQMVSLPELQPWHVPDEAGCYRLWPHRDRCAGGFAAALVRPEDDEGLPRQLDSSSTRIGGRQTQSNWQPIDFRAALQQWGRAEDQPFYQQRTSVCWFSPRIPSSWYSLAYRGVEVAQQFGQHWQPAWPLAVLDRRLIDQSGPGAAELDQCNRQDQLTEALSFEPHEPVELSDSEAIAYFSGTSLHGYGQAGALGAPELPGPAIDLGPGAGEAAGIGTTDRLEETRGTAGKSEGTRRTADGLRDAVRTAAGIGGAAVIGSGWLVAHWRGRPLGWAKRAAGQLKNHLPKPLRHPTLTAPPNRT